MVVVVGAVVVVVDVVLVVVEIAVVAACCPRLGVYKPSCRRYRQSRSQSPPGHHMPRGADLSAPALPNR
jgi:hypothetical protein